MTRFWAMAPWPSNEPEVFEHVWEYDRRNGVIAIGGDELGDPAGLSPSEFKRRWRERCSTWPGGEHQVWNFYNKLRIDDFVLAKRGRQHCIAIGLVTSGPWFDLAEGRDITSGFSQDHRSNFVRVDLLTVDQITLEPRRWFPRKTLTEIKDPTLYSELLRSVSQ